MCVCAIVRDSCDSFDFRNPPPPEQIQNEILLTPSNTTAVNICLYTYIYNIKEREL